MKPNTSNTNWEKLLVDAVNQPGVILKAFSTFHNYSIGNQLLAMFQCFGRGIAPGPINTYNRWQQLGRQVKKGEKAITLCMPVTVKDRTAKANPNDPDRKFTLFVERAKWFVLSQTEGDDFIEPKIPDWDFKKALANLDVTQIPFDITDGNVLGFARKREFALNPVCPADHVHSTTFHELAHILLGHTTEGDCLDNDRTPRNIREAEAEAVALICTESLQLSGSEFSRGYIQHWYKENKIPDKSCQKIFKVANKILQAGRDAVQNSTDVDSIRKLGLRYY